MSLWTHSERSLAFDLGKLRNGTRGRTDLIEQLEAISTQIFIADIDGDLVEKGINGRTQLGDAPHGGAEVLLANRGRCLALGCVDCDGKALFFRLLIKCCIGRRSIALPVFFFLDANDVCCPLVAREQVLTVLAVEKFAERFDAADDENKVILTFERKNGVYEVVASALLAKLDLEAIGQEGEQVGRNKAALYRGLPCACREQTILD